MTPIKELCARLDELEIKHRNHGYENHVWWEGKDGVDWHAENRPSVKDPYVIVDAEITPKQAIASTVGVGTCHMKVKDNLAETEGMGDVWLECDKCHWQMPLEPSTPKFKFCPNCGRRIEVSE